MGAASEKLDGHAAALDFRHSVVGRIVIDYENLVFRCGLSRLLLSGSPIQEPAL
jgi:hypothetical protein